MAHRGASVYFALNPGRYILCQCRAHSLAAATLQVMPMPHFYEPDLTEDPNSPFVRDAAGKLVRRSYWMDMTDQSFVMAMTRGIGANLTNDEKELILATCVEST